MGVVCSCVPQDSLAKSSRRHSETKAAVSSSSPRKSKRRSTATTTESHLNKSFSSRNPLQHPSSTMMSLCNHPKRPSRLATLAVGGVNGAGTATTTTPTTTPATGGGGTAAMLSFTAIVGGGSSSAQQRRQLRAGDFSIKREDDDEFTNEDSGKYQPLGSSLFDAPSSLEPPPMFPSASSEADCILPAASCSGGGRALALEAHLYNGTPLRHVAANNDKPTSLTSVEDEAGRRRRSELDPWS